MSTLGTQLPSGATLHRISAGSNNLVAVAQIVAPEPGWLTNLGAWVKRTDGDSRVWFGVYSRAENGEPFDLLGRTALLTPSSGGGNLTAGVAYSSPILGGAATAIRVEAGQIIYLALKAQGSAVDVGAVADSAATHYRRTHGAGPPPDRFTPANTTTAPALGLYALFTPNDAPAVTLSSPAAGAAITTLTPTFVATFTDPNSGAPTVDRLREYQIEVRRASDQVLLWNGAAATFPASPAERTAAATSRIYSGSTLTAGVGYEWRAALADDTLTYSPWSAWRAFSINALGTMTPVSPTTKIDTASTAIAWQGRWSHPQAYSADRVQVRVLRDGDVLKLGADLAKTVASSAAPGTLFTITAAEAGIGALQAGAYTFQLRGRSATGGQWSPWSDEQAFTINSVPTTPTNLQPPDAFATTTRPLLEFTTYDPDADDVGGIDTLFEIELIGPTSAVTVITTTAYDAVRAVASHQLTTGQVSLYGTYLWRARSQDISAGVLGWSAWSRQQSFEYVNGPVVTITAPLNGAVVTTAQPTITWTASDQQKFRVRLFRKDRTDLVYDSGQIVSTVGEHRIPAGKLTNSSDVDQVVTVWNTPGVAGNSTRTRFSVTYAPAATLTGVEVSGYRYALDPEPTAALIAWDWSTYPPGEFEAYQVYVRNEGDDASANILLAQLRNVSQNQWIDPHIPSDRPTVYSVSQVQRVGSDLIESTPIEVTFTLRLSVVVIASVDDPGQRSVLYWHPADGEATRAGKFTRPQQLYNTWGSRGRPTVVRGIGSQRIVDQTFQLIDDSLGSMFDHLRALIALWEAPPPTRDQPARGVVSFRDNFHAFFGQVLDVSYVLHDRYVDVTLQVAETAYSDRARQAAGYTIVD